MIAVLIGKILKGPFLNTGPIGSSPPKHNGKIRVSDGICVITFFIFDYLEVGRGRIFAKMPVNAYEELFFGSPEYSRVPFFTQYVFLKKKKVVCPPMGPLNI